MFTPDDLVVYPAQGVGQIERIDSKTVGGLVCELYIVRIRANNVTLMVPVNNAAHVGLRTLTPKDEAAAILESLRNDSGKVVYTGQNWNRCSPWLPCPLGWWAPLWDLPSAPWWSSSF